MSFDDFLLLGTDAFDKLTQFDTSLGSAVNLHTSDVNDDFMKLFTSQPLPHSYPTPHIQSVFTRSGPGHVKLAFSRA